jgi:hypothetical protein
MSTILSLPSETLTEVVLRLNFLEVIKLWICGNTALNWRLSKGQAVRNVALKVERPNVPRWPSLLGQLAGLEFFSYDRTPDSEEMALKAHQLLVLPKNLKTLKISAKHDVAAAEIFFRDHPGHFTNLRSLSLVNFAKPHPLGFTLPSTLEELVLGSWLAPVGVLKLSELPPNLLQFRGNILQIEDPGEAAGDAKFPETLQSLQLFVKIHVHFSHLLPQQLETLMYSCQSDQQSVCIRDWSDLQRLSLKELSLTVFGSFDVQEALQLPRTLKSISLSFIHGKITPEWSIRVIEALPQNVTSLRGVFPDSMPISVIKCLPSTLVWDGTEKIDPEGLAIMPLNTQSVYLRPNADLSKISCFPPNLQALSIHTLNDSLASMLPSTLTRLSIQSHQLCLEETQIRCLPRNLKYLIINTETGTQIDKMESFKQLPASLMHLRVTKRSTRTSGDFMLIPTSESSQWLPHSLTCLDLYPLEHLTPCWIDGLPKTLRSIALECRTLSSSLFPSLAEFSVLTALKIRALQTPDDQWRHCLAHLPPKLIHVAFLDSSQGAKTDLTNDSFLWVPASVVKIDIPESPKLDKACCAHLPNLVCVNFGNHLAKPWFVRPSN